ncbi:hypothetical protein [Ancylobacter terrae]|uniref:hypothetical protein n=1 Tax=Ancylobacter sp. sgz301288 TaxID=3342077 RepID=UPI003858614A
MTPETPHHGGRPAGKTHALKQRALHEVRSFLIMFVYLWVLLSLFVLNETVVSREHGLDLKLQGFALINALVLAKVMLVVEGLELARWLRSRPAIVVIIYEAALCTTFFLLFHVLERHVVDYFRGPGEATREVAIGGGGFAGVLIVAVILFVSMLPFFAFKNVARAIGPDRMRRVLFHRPPHEW